MLGNSDPDEIPLHVWRNKMAQGLQSFSVCGDALNFSKYAKNGPC